MMAINDADFFARLRGVIEKGWIRYQTIQAIVVQVALV